MRSSKRDFYLEEWAALASLTRPMTCCVVRFFTKHSLGSSARRKPAHPSLKTGLSKLN